MTTYPTTPRTGTTTALLLLAALAARPSPLPAQQAFPYRLRAAREIGLSAGGLALLMGATAAGKEQDPLTPAEIALLNPMDVNAFDRGATHQWSTGAGQASDILVYTLLAAPVVLMVTPPGSHAPLTLGVMYVESLLLSDGLSGLLKATTNRIRPYAYNDDPDIPPEHKETVTARRSFPSGHTIQAFTAAVFLNTVYGKLHPDSRLRPWLWAGSLTAAGAVGYLRYSSGNHFPTDVLAGAAIGSLAGWAIPRVHESGDVQVAVAPSAAGTTVLFSLPF